MKNSNRNLDLFSSLADLGLAFEIQDALSGKSLSTEEIRRSVNVRGCTARLGFRIDPSLIGCGLSHREVYKKILASSYKWALVLEEDAVLKDFDTDQIFEIIKLCESSPTIVQLFSRGSRLMKLKSRKSLSGSNRIIFDFMPRIIGSGAAGYLINLSAAKIALDVKKLNGAPDWPEWAKQIRYRGVYPWMIYESADGSTIPTTSVSRSRYILRRIAQMSGLHYIFYRKEYSGLKSYLNEEIIPYLLFTLWRLRGSKFYSSDVGGPQVL